MSNFCPSCGTPLEEGAKFCPKCGYQLVENPQKFQPQEQKNNASMMYEKAPLGKRFWAWMLDGLIAFAMMIPGYLYGIFNLVIMGAVDSSNTMEVFNAMWGGWGFLFLVPAMIYGFIKDGLNHGQSYGKKAVKIKVIKLEDHSDCTIGLSCLRGVITAVINFIPLVGWLIEPIVVLVTEDGRRLADRVAGTMIVKA